MKKNEFGSFKIADSQKSEILLKNNLQGNDDLSCSPSRSSKNLTCLRVPWLLKSLSSDQPAQATVIYVSHSVALMQFQEITKNIIQYGSAVAQY